MTRFLAFVFLSLLFACGPLISEAQAQRNPGSFGIGVGSTTHTSGLSLKQFAGPTALQATLGCWRSCDGLGGSLDLLVNMPPLATGNALALAWNFGAGAALGIDDDGLGAIASFVLGLEFNLRVLPIDFVLEWRPGMQVSPDLDLRLAGFGGHLRFYLN